MTKLEIFKRLMTKAKANGYTGNDYQYQIGYILEGTNIYSLVFREDFAKAAWPYKVPGLSGDLATSEYRTHLANLSVSEDKWKYLEETINSI